MNIFILDRDPKVCAQYHCDKHVVKMILETAQMICTVLNEVGHETPTSLHILNIHVRCGLKRQCITTCGLEVLRTGSTRSTSDVITKLIITSHGTL